jgi:hypothetical protein
MFDRGGGVGGGLVALVVVVVVLLLLLLVAVEVDVEGVVEEVLLLLLLFDVAIAFVINSIGLFVPEIPAEMIAWAWDGWILIVTPLLVAPEALLLLLLLLLLLFVRVLTESVDVGGDFESEVGDWREAEDDDDDDDEVEFEAEFDWRILDVSEDNEDAVKAVITEILELTTEGDTEGVIECAPVDTIGVGGTAWVTVTAVEVEDRDWELFFFVSSFKKSKI